jgi:hypothetical protein
MSGIITLSFFLGRNRSSKKTLHFFRSRLHFVRCSERLARISSDPLVDDLQRSGWSSRIRGSPVVDTTRRLEDLEPSAAQPGLLFESAWGLPDIQFHRQVCGQQTFILVWRSVAAGLVETRRLELLTLSLQRRCSSN